MDRKSIMTIGILCLCLLGTGALGYSLTDHKDRVYGNPTYVGNVTSTKIVGNSLNYVREVTLDNKVTFTIADTATPLIIGDCYAFWLDHATVLKIEPR